MFSCEYWEIFKNIYFEEHLRAATSALCHLVYITCRVNVQPYLRCYLEIFRCPNSQTVQRQFLINFFLSGFLLVNILLQKFDTSSTKKK